MDSLHSRQAAAQALLGEVHQRLNQGDGPGALTSLLQAVQLLQGSEGSTAAAAQFRSSFLQRASADELTALANQLQSVSIAPGNQDPASASVNITLSNAQPSVPAQCAIVQQQRLHEQQHAMLQHAQAESYLCERCGGMVAISRWVQHQQQWCPALPSSGAM